MGNWWPWVKKVEVQQKMKNGQTDYTAQPIDGIKQWHQNHERFNKNGPKLVPSICYNVKND